MTVDMAITILSARRYLQNTIDWDQEESLTMENLNSAIEELNRSEVLLWLDTQGGHLMPAHIPYGYVIKNGEPVIDPEKAENGSDHQLS